MKLSIILPSLSTDPLYRTLANIRDATRCDYEVIVVSPAEPVLTDYPRAIWLQEDQPRGAIAAQALAFPFCSGDFVMAWVDDHILADGWDTQLIHDYEDREPKAVPFLMGLRHTVSQHQGTVFGIYYPYFPFARRAHVEKVGWIDDAFHLDFGDCDLALRFWAAGGRCEWSRIGLICAHRDNNRPRSRPQAEADADLITFTKRWGETYGKGWDLTQLRGFDLDLVPEDNPLIIGDRTIYRNDPEFKRIHAGVNG